MGIAVAIIGAILAIFSVVVIHEFGHFIVARWMGVHVIKFSIGFGRPLVSFHSKKGTEFAIGWIPLGGYVRMLGEGDDIPAKELINKSYNQKNVMQRMGIVLAGPAMNFVLAAILYWVLFLPGVVHVKPVIGSVVPGSAAAEAGLKRNDVLLAVNTTPVKNWREVVMTLIEGLGDKDPMRLTIQADHQKKPQELLIPKSRWKLNEKKPDFLKELGIEPYRPKFPMVIGRVLPESPAAKGGLKEGDRILSIDGKPYDDMYSAVTWLRKHPAEQVLLVIQRDENQLKLKVQVGSKLINGKQEGYMGYTIVPPKWPESMLIHEHFTVMSAWLPAIQQTTELIRFNGLILGKMLLGKVSMKSLGGPISIFQMAGQASQQNYRVYLGFLAFLSVALGFINLLPIPGLDGGHFFFQLIELVFRRPVPLRIQAICFRIGLIALILLILHATMNDLSRIFGS